MHMFRRDSNAPPEPAFRRPDSSKGKIDIAEAAFAPDLDATGSVDDAQIVEAATILSGSAVAATHAAPAPALVVTADSQLHLDRRHGGRAGT
jgi:hypothetical protein